MASSVVAYDTNAPCVFNVQREESPSETHVTPKHAMLVEASLYSEHS